MKKWFAVALVVFFLSGCAAERESGFYDHSSMYKDWDHMKFSIWGYKNVDQKEAKESKDQDWWGKTVEGKNN